MTLNLDIAPTILDLAGLSIDPSANGRSVVPLLDGESPPWRTDWYYEFLWQREGIPIPRTEGVRTERWKYNLYLDGEPGYEELYDLRADPEEESNLVSSPDHQDRLGQLRARHQVWKDSLAAWRPDSAWTDPA
jgi:arylsulfatase A-like enzyme